MAMTKKRCVLEQDTLSALLQFTQLNNGSILVRGVMSGAMSSLEKIAFKINNLFSYYAFFAYLQLQITKI